MIRSNSFVSAACALFACSAFGCSAASKDGASSVSGSEVAVSAVSGALNNNSGSGVARYSPQPQEPRGSLVERALAALNPIGTAYAATWSCTGDTLSPAFSGPGADPYEFTPASCSVSWRNGRSASSKWSGPFTLDYGASCDATHPFMELQAAGCALTRTTGAGGTSRTITGPDGNSYAIDHDTNGAGSGWDSSVSPAPSSDGVQLTCGAGGCAASRTLVISGSHLTGTVTVDGTSAVLWNHTASTGAGGLTVTGAGADRVVSGTVIVQHNIIKETSTTTFASVGYGEPLCCFPTTGRVTTTFGKGENVGKTESIAFTGVCGEATLTRPDGVTTALTFQHCL